MGVVLAAGAGLRLRPLTALRPKALCPVNNVALLDLAIDRVMPHVEAIAVNAHYLAEQIERHLRDRDVMLSLERPISLGTAGALGALRGWIDGRDVLVHNADAWITDPLDRLVEGWTGEQPRLLMAPAGSGRVDFSQRRFVGVSLLPGATAMALPARSAGLFDAVWREGDRRGSLEFVDVCGEAIDCGTPSDYLRANLAASRGQSVIGPNCIIKGRVERSVVWAGCSVRREENLVDAIRATNDLTLAATIAYPAGIDRTVYGEI